MRRILSIILLRCTLSAFAVGGAGQYQWSVELTNFVSRETGKAPEAYLWIPEGCKEVKAVIMAQQNMTEEALFRMPSFKKHMAELGIGLVWVAPAFSNSWDPSTNCQTVFQDFMTGLAYQSGHLELEHVAVIPFGHSAQATFPWNFAAWNNERTLCILSFHGDAPRTNLCGFGTSNIEWGRTRNIDGIPGLMIEGEYEWWEARVVPALAFRIMYPESCVSFLCDAGRGHFDCAEYTAEYIAKFIEKALKVRMAEDGTLKKVNPRDGWLACRYNPDMEANDGDGNGAEIFKVSKRPAPAPYTEYKGDRHDAFWYFDREMAELTEQRYAATRGKKMQYVGFEYKDALVEYNPKAQGGMSIELIPESEGNIFQIKGVYTDSSHSALCTQHSVNPPHIEVVSGPVEKIDDATFRIVPYEAGSDNPRRSFSIWLVAVGESDRDYKTAVQPILVKIKK